MQSVGSSEQWSLDKNTHLLSANQLLHLFSMSFLNSVPACLVCSLESEGSDVDIEGNDDKETTTAKEEIKPEQKKEDKTGKPDGDEEFVVTEDMEEGADDEQTLEEEEKMEGEGDHSHEIAALQKEGTLLTSCCAFLSQERCLIWVNFSSIFQGEIPIEELLEMYGGTQGDSTDLPSEEELSDESSEEGLSELPKGLLDNHQYYSCYGSLWSWAGFRHKFSSCAESAEIRHADSSYVEKCPSTCFSTRLHTLSWKSTTPLSRLPSPTPFQSWEWHHTHGVYFSRIEILHCLETEGASGGRGSAGRGGRGGWIFMLVCPYFSPC